MRQLRNTLYVSTEGAWLHKDGENLVMDVEGQKRGRVPIHMLQALVCFGRVMLSPQLMGFCAEKGITVTFLNTYGKFLARMEGPISGSVLLRRRQHLACENPTKALEIVRNIVCAKVHNQRAVVSRVIRDHAEKIDDKANGELEDAQKRLKRVIECVRLETNIESIRGFEGDAGHVYFQVFNHFIRAQKEDFIFDGRERRPPRDPVNALLSFIYTLLTHDCRSALETTGLDAASGFLHFLRVGRPSLALDLMEEFRPFLADRLVLSLINRKQVQASDFSYLPNGAVVMKDDARKTVLMEWQQRKADTLTHPWFEESVPVGLFPWLQAQLLARHLHGEIDAYVPFLWK